MTFATQPTFKRTGQTGFEPAVRTVSVWLLTNAPSPYQAELFTAIAHDGRIDLTVRFMRSASAAGRAASSEFPSRTMWAPLPEVCGDELRLHPRAIWETAFGHRDCFVLSGLYTSVTFLICALILKIRRKPWIVWLERPHGFQSGSTASSSWSPIRWLRDRIRHWLLQSSSRVLCIGSLARKEYAELGIDPSKLDVLPYCCDVSRYDGVTEADTAAWRMRYGFEEQAVFLFSGQLIPRKGADTLIKAFRRLAAEDSSCSLVLLGEGPQRAELESLVGPGHAARVRFLGHLPQEELPVVFCAADVFVFPSRHDGWGVVINEACAAGLPVIATWQTGAAHDLVKPGESGFLLEADDEAELYDAMKQLLDDTSLRRRMGEHSRSLVERFSTQRGASEFADCVHRALR